MIFWLVTNFLDGQQKVNAHALFVPPGYDVVRLTTSKKYSYWCSRKQLDMNYSYQWRKKNFDGKTKLHQKLQQLSGEEIFDTLSQYCQVLFGKKCFNGSN